MNVLGSPHLEAAFMEYLRRLDMEGKLLLRGHVKTYGSISSLTERRYREAQCKLALVEAEGLEREKKFRRAGDKFAQAFAHLLPETNLKVPIDATNEGGVRCPVYIRFTMDECLTAMTCANGVSHCLYERGKYVEVSRDFRLSVVLCVWLTCYTRPLTGVRKSTCCIGMLDLGLRLSLVRRDIYSSSLPYDQLTADSLQTGIRTTHLRRYWSSTAYGSLACSLLQMHSSNSGIQARLHTAATSGTTSSKAFLRAVTSMCCARRYSQSRLFKQPWRPVILILRRIEARPSLNPRCRSVARGRSSKFRLRRRSRLAWPTHASYTRVSM